MASLPGTLRRRLERTVVDAREVAEAGARAAVERLAVNRPEPFAEMPAPERELRVRLRAHASQLGDPRKANGEQSIERLVVECAYESWHQMLFARFLAENRLLIHPEHGVSVTLAECEELAAHAGEKNGWRLAGRFAARMLPAIFRPDDPILSVRFAPEHQQALEALLAGLPPDVFTADDSLGWVYQFWQTKRKDEINKSGNKIGADELPAVTQLFTEPYMVHFLLHNTLGAWWAGKVLATRPELVQSAASEEELRRACTPPGCDWAYLRFVHAPEGGPWCAAAGVFGGWPERAAAMTVLDPCCGSGHFLVEAFRILVSMRMAEEGLSPREACDAVLSQNLFGLEIDERCTQIAAFNVALAAWKYPGAGDYRLLPDLHVACSGRAAGAKEEDWLKLAGKDERLRAGMHRLYRLFQDAPTLGSLIDPRREEADLLTTGFDALRPLLEQALAGEEVKRDARATEAGIAAQGMAKAAALLAGSYTLVITNVPYLGRGKQDTILKTHLERHSKNGKADLATAFVLRCIEFCARAGTVATVTPQNWLFLTSYARFRHVLLTQHTLNAAVLLGSNAFQNMNWWAANTSLTIISEQGSQADSHFLGMNVGADKLIANKMAFLGGNGAAQASMHNGFSVPEMVGPLQLSQRAQLDNPDSRITMTDSVAHALLGDHATVGVGVQNGDSLRLLRCAWEVRFPLTGAWTLIQMAPLTSGLVRGCATVILYDQHCLNQEGLSWHPQALKLDGREAFAIRNMGNLPSSRLLAPLLDQSATLVVPKANTTAVAFWSFLQSDDFRTAVRQIDQKVNVTPATFGKIPFDLAHWQKVSAEQYPNGLSEPESDDPTQWLFHGRPEGGACQQE